jgi:DME family drug/metabolite transporter
LGPPGADPFTVGLVRLVVGGIGLVLVAAATKRIAPIGISSLLAIVLGGLAVLGYQLAFFAGVRLSGVALGTVITIGSAPVLTGLLAWLVFGERPGRRWLASTAVAVLGIGLMVGPSGGVNLLGAVLDLAAGFSYAVYATAAKRLLDDQPPLGAMALVFGAGALAAAALVPVGDFGFLADSGGWAMALWLGVATTTMAYVLYGYGLRATPVATAATLTLFEPVVATTLGVVILAERPQTISWLGAILVLAALGLLIGRSDPGPRSA